MKRIRIIALLLACLMMLPLSLIGCKKEESEGEEGTVDTYASADDGSGDQLGLPEDLNYGGEDFVILGWSDEPSTYDFYSEGETSQKIQSAVFRRNSMLEDRLGVALSYKLIPGNNSNKGEFVKTVQNDVMASSESEYDAVACYSMCAINLATSNLLVDMSTLQFPEFEKSWWSQSLINNCKLDGGIYFCSGDLATSTMMQAFLVGINMDKLAEHPELDDPRELVKAGTWTYEKLFEMTKGLGIDENTNNAKDANDIYGLIASSNAMWDQFYIGSGMKYLSMDNQGRYDVSFEFESEKTYDLIQFLNSQVVVGKDVASVYDYNIFTRGDSLFALSELGYLMQNKSSIDFTYSFVPTPKYEESQKQYYTTLGFPFSIYCITQNASDKEMSGAVLEYMEYESNKQLRPAVFDAAKYQESTEALDAEMFDIIINGITYDLGRIMHGVFEGLGGDGWAASPVMMFRRGIIYGYNLYTQIMEYDGPLNEGITILNNFKRK